jgi:serine/threonine protein kinase
MTTPSQPSSNPGSAASPRSSPYTIQQNQSSSSTSLEQWLATRKIKSELLSLIKNDLGVENPEDFTDLEDDDIQDFVTSNNLNKIQKNRFVNAYREIKYKETSKSRSSSVQSRSLYAVEVVDTKNSNYDGSFVVNQYRIFTDKNLSANLEGHCKVLIGETTDRKRTPIVAKLSTDSNSAKTLLHEHQLLDHIHKTLGTSGSEFVIDLIDWVENYDNNGNHIMFLERAETNNGDLNQIFKGQYLNAVDDFGCIKIAKNLLEIGSSLSKAGVVWGDVKPGNIVSYKEVVTIRYKAIDFDSSRRDGGAGASLRGPTFISNEFLAGDSTTMVTPGYVSPERAAAIQNKRNITADSRQDVFVMGLVIYQLFAKKPYFTPKQIKDESYLQILISDDFTANLEAIKHKNVKKFLQEMLVRQPSSRKKFDQILKHNVFNASSSISTSNLATKSQVKGIETKIDQLSILQQRLVQNSDRTLDMLEDITEHQLIIMDQIDIGFQKLSSNVNKAIGVVGNAVQLMINLQQSDIPILFLCVPTDLNQSDGFLSWCSKLKKKALKKSGWKKFLTLYVCDEGPLLLPSKIKKKEEPAHEGIEFELPGPLMIKLAPLIYVFSKLLEIASDAGNMFGIPLPSNIPGLGNILENSDQLKKMTCAFERFSALNDQMEDAKEMVDAIQQTLDDTKNANEALESVQKTMKGSYGALKELLTTGEAAEKWQEFIDKGEMAKVYKKKGGTVHWVRASDVEVLVKSELYSADQRLYTYNGDQGETTVNATDKVSLNKNRRDQHPSQVTTDDFFVGDKVCVLLGGILCNGEVVNVSVGDGVKVKYENGKEDEYTPNKLKKLIEKGEQEIIRLNEEKVRLQKVQEAKELLAENQRMEKRRELEAKEEDERQKKEAQEKKDKERTHSGKWKTRWTSRNSWTCCDDKSKKNLICSLYIREEARQLGFLVGGDVLGMDGNDIINGVIKLIDSAKGAVVKWSNSNVNKTYTPKKLQRVVEKARREKAAREKAAREKRAREQAAREKAARDKAAREKAARDKAAREKAAREKAAREKAAREKAAREKAAREKAAAKEELQRIQPGFYSLKNALYKAKKYGINQIKLLNGVHDEKGEMVVIDFPITIIGESKDGCTLIGGLNMEGNQEDDVTVKNLTISQSKGHGVCGYQGMSFHLFHLNIEKSEKCGVFMGGTKRNTMSNCQVSHSKYSGVLVNTGLITMNGDGTSIHNNVTGGYCGYYGLNTGNNSKWSRSGSIHLVSPLTKESVSINNGGGGNYGGSGTIKTQQTARYNNTKWLKLNVLQMRNQELR